MKQIRRAAAALLLLSLLLTLFPAASAAQDSPLEQTAAWLLNALPAPSAGTQEGDWAVLALARSGVSLPDGYLARYYTGAEAFVAACEGLPHEKKYTESSRLILTLTAIGADPRSVAGYNLLLPLGDYEKTIWQGTNGPVWALLALDSGGYEIPLNPEAVTQATRQLYLERILQLQLEGGGFSLSGTGAADPDMTAMALLALAPYRAQPKVPEAITRALDCLSALQGTDGGFESWGASALESTVQVMTALYTIGLPLDDARFVKGGATLTGHLMRYHDGSGGFRHTVNEQEANLMATEQALCALVAAARAADGQSGFYTMDDVTPFTPPAAGETPGLPGRHPDVCVPAAVDADISFPDLDRSPLHGEILVLAARGIINGKDSGLFDPGGPITRAEFCAMTVRALGLSHAGEAGFSDVPQGSWFFPYVSAARAYGIVNGRSETVFAPYDGISRQEVATMLTRAAALCGLETALDEATIRETLAAFDDGRTVADWARGPLAFCLSAGVFDGSALEIEPAKPATRAEVAHAVFRMLEAAKLL